MTDEKTKEAKPAADQAKKAPKEKQAKGDKSAQKSAAGAEKKAKTPKLKGKAMLEKYYHEVCAPELMRMFSYTNRMRVPKLVKIVVNTSMKEALQDVKVLQTAADEIAAITGQRPVITKAKTSIANFKLRKGQSIGARVTLRERNMFEFLSRLVNVALPRVRDFKGVSPKAFDGRGNYTLGLTEQIIFPEINFDRVNKVYGMNISFVTTARTNEEGMALLKLLGMPFRAA